LPRRDRFVGSLIYKEQNPPKLILEIDMPPQKSRELVSNHTIRRSIMGSLSAIALFGPPKTAHAEPPHYRIELSVPPSLPECNREPDLIGMVVPMLAGPMLDPPAARVLVVRIAKTPEIYRMDVIVRDLEGQTLEEERSDFPANMSCFEVLYRAALRAAVQMNKGVAIVKAPPAPPPPPPPPPPAPQCPATNTLQSSAPKRAPPERHWFVGLGESTVMGAAPTSVLGLQATVGWNWARAWSLEGNLRGTFPETGLPIEVTRIRVDSILSVTLAPCYRPKVFGVCLLATGGNRWGKPLTLVSTGGATSQFIGIGPRVFAETHLTERWSVRIDAELVLLGMSNWTQNGADPRWNSARITGGTNVSLLARF